MPRLICVKTDSPARDSFYLLRVKSGNPGARGSIGVEGGSGVTRSFVVLVLGVAAISTVLSDSTTMGPTTIPRDHVDYAAAISDSWKNQMLLNR